MLFVALGSQPNDCLLRDEKFTDQCGCRVFDHGANCRFRKKVHDPDPESHLPARTPNQTLSLPSRSFGQVRGFDGFRGVIVLIVFVAHFNVFLPIPTFISVYLFLCHGFSQFFFVLSGFLITALLLREQARQRWYRHRSFLPAQSSPSPTRPLRCCSRKCAFCLCQSSMVAHRSSINIVGPTLLLQLLHRFSI